MATPVPIPKHSRTRQSEHVELSNSTQASIVSQSPQAKKKLFFSFPPPNRKALKYPGWRNQAAKVMGNDLVRTTRGDQSSTLRRSRIDQNQSLRAGNGHWTIPVIERYRLSL
jgi:hypothetical protein